MHFAILLLSMIVSPQASDVSGKLAMVSGAPVLRIGVGSEAKEIRLVSNDDHIQLILADERLFSRVLHVQGTWKEKDRVFEVESLHTVRDGKEFKVAYYCPICNVWAFKPGPCICCLQPVELRELGEGEEAQ